MVSGALEAILGGLGAAFGASWGGLGGLGAVLGDLEWSWGGLWEVLGRLGAVLGCPGRLLGGSWGAIGRSKIDPEIDLKLDAKTSRIATEKNRSGATPAEGSEVETPQRDSHEGARKIYQNRYRYD